MEAGLWPRISPLARPDSPSLLRPSSSGSTHLFFPPSPPLPWHPPSASLPPCTRLASSLSRKVSFRPETWGEKGVGLLWSLLIRGWMDELARPEERVKRSLCTCPASPLTHPPRSLPDAGPALALPQRDPTLRGGCSSHPAPRQTRAAPPSRDGQSPAPRGGAPSLLAFPHRKQEIAERGTLYSS